MLRNQFKNSDSKQHFRMYKSGKQWVYQALIIGAIFAGSAVAITTQGGSVAAHADTTTQSVPSATSLGFTITTDGQRHAKITGYNGPTGVALTIPSQVTDSNGNIQTVTNIGDYAFSNKNLTSVTIPNSVTSIGNDAFGDNNLTSVTIPNSVTSISQYAFDSNKLTSVTIPNSVTSIGVQAFSNNQLTSVTIPNSVTSIDWYAFYRNKLTSVNMPNQALLTQAQSKSVFDASVSLQVVSSATSLGFTITTDGQGHATIMGYTGSGGNITIPSQVTDSNGNIQTITSIGGTAFQNTNLTSVTIPNTVTSIGPNTFSYNELTSITIPNSVTSIGANAFNGNQLTSVNIPSSVTSIDWYAFGQNNLTSVVLPTQDVLNQAVANKSFDSNVKLSIPVPSADDLGFLYTEDGQGNATITGLSISKIWDSDSITIPSRFTDKNGNVVTVTGIGDNVFQDAPFTTVVLPNTITSIGQGAFQQSKLTSINLPSSLTEIKANTFKGTALASIVIPDSITAIGDSAFEGDTALSNVTLSKNLKTVGNNAFQATQISDSFFKNKSNFLPDGLLTIGDGAFSTAGRSGGILNIPSSVTSVGSYAFANNNFLSLVVSDGTKYNDDTFGIIYGFMDLTVNHKPGSTQSYPIPSNVLSGNNLYTITIASDVVNRSTLFGNNLDGTYWKGGTEGGFYSASQIFKDGSQLSGMFIKADPSEVTQKYLTDANTDLTSYLTNASNSKSSTPVTQSTLPNYLQGKLPDLTDTITADNATINALKDKINQATAASSYSGQTPEQVKAALTDKVAELKKEIDAAYSKLANDQAQQAYNTSFNQQVDAVNSAITNAVNNQKDLDDTAKSQALSNAKDAVQQGYNDAKNGNNTTTNQDPFYQTGVALYNNDKTDFDSKLAQALANQKAQLDKASQDALNAQKAQSDQDKANAVNNQKAQDDADKATAVNNQKVQDDADKAQALANQQAANDKAKNDALNAQKSEDDTKLQAAVQQATQAGNDNLDAAYANVKAGYNDAKDNKVSPTNNDRFYQLGVSLYNQSLSNANSQLANSKDAVTQGFNDAKNGNDTTSNKDPFYQTGVTLYNQAVQSANDKLNKVNDLINAAIAKQKAEDDADKAQALANQQAANDKAKNDALAQQSAQSSADKDNTVNQLKAYYENIINNSKGSSDKQVNDLSGQLKNTVNKYEQALRDKDTEYANKIAELMKEYASKLDNAIKAQKAKDKAAFANRNTKARYVKVSKNNKNFKKYVRILKKAHVRGYQLDTPTMRVLKSTKLANGKLKLTVRLDGHKITFTEFNKGDIRNAYYSKREVNKITRVKVTRTIHLHTREDFTPTNYTQVIKKGTILKVQGLTEKNGISRFVLANGQHITANKYFVSIVK